MTLHAPGETLGIDRAWLHGVEEVNTTGAFVGGSPGLVGRLGPSAAA